MPRMKGIQTRILIQPWGGLLKDCYELPADGTFRLLLPALNGQAHVLRTQDVATFTAVAPQGANRPPTGGGGGVEPLAVFDFEVAPGVTTQAPTD